MAAYDGPRLRTSAARLLPLLLMGCVEAALSIGVWSRNGGVPADAECGSDCMTSEEVCPEGFLAEGFQTKLDELDGGGTSFRGFDVICTPITAQISGM